MRPIATLPLALTLALVPACSETNVRAEAAEARESAGEAWRDLRSYASDQGDAFADAAHRRIDDLERSVSELGDEAGESADDVRDRVARGAEALRSKIDEMADSTGDAWSEVRDEIADQLDELEDLVNSNA